MSGTASSPLQFSAGDELPVTCKHTNKAVDFKFSGPDLFSVFFLDLFRSAFLSFFLSHRSVEECWVTRRSSGGDRVCGEELLLLEDGVDGPEEEEALLRGGGSDAGRPKKGCCSPVEGETAERGRFVGIGSVPLIFNRK